MLLLMPFTRCCNDGPPPDLQGWDPCSPLDIGDVTIGDITVDVDFTPVIDKLCEIEVLLQDLEVTADGQTQFGCVCDAAGEFQGWVFKRNRLPHPPRAQTVLLR